MLEHFASRAATELTYIKRSSYTNNVTTEDNWTFELVVRSNIDVSIFVLGDFMRRDQFNQQQRNNDTFYRPTVVNAQCIVGSENFPDAGIN